MQSMVHYLVYSDLFDTEGLISSPPKQGRTKDIFKTIDVYDKDYHRSISEQLRNRVQSIPPPRKDTAKKPKVPAG